MMRGGARNLFRVIPSRNVVRMFDLEILKSGIIITVMKEAQKVFDQMLMRDIECSALVFSVFV